MAAIFADSAEGILRTSGLVAASSNYTWATWYYLPAHPPAGKYRTLLYFGNDPALYSQYVAIYQRGDNGDAFDGTIVLALTGGVETYGPAMAAGWHFVAYVRSGNVQNIYLDGTLASTQTINVSAETWTHLYVGTDTYPIDWEIGQAAYTREWDTALTVGELMAERTSATVVKTANLWSNAPLAADLLDISGNGRHWADAGGTITFGDQPAVPTRYYPTAKAPNVRVDGPFEGTWATQGAYVRSWGVAQWTNLLSTSKVDSGVCTTTTFDSNQQGDYDTHWRRWQTRPGPAQTIDGTVDLCLRVLAAWNGVGVSVVRYKLHIYIAVGQTTAVRHVLLDNYVDSVNFPTTATFRQLASAQALTAGDREDGDTVITELGWRVVSSPTPVPTYPPSAATLISFRGIGATTAGNVPLVDAVAGDTSTTVAPWIEFSAAIQEDPLPAAPANDACADATVIAGLPYLSAFLDTTQSADTNRAVWWKLTAPFTGKLLVTGYGSNYAQIAAVFTGGCGVLTPVSVVTATTLDTHRSQLFAAFDALGGTEDWIRITNRTANGFNAINSGGSCRIAVGYRESPAIDDLYLPCGVLAVFRGTAGTIVNATPVWETTAPTGIAIDYRGLAMDSLAGGTNSNARVYLGTHNFELVEILDLPTLSLDTAEVDFIGDPWSVPGTDIHPATLYLTAAGMLHVGWFGDGYLFVSGPSGVDLSSLLNSVASVAAYSALKSLPAVDGDNQPGAPFTDTVRPLTVEAVSPWPFSVDEANNRLYYTSGGFYLPAGGATRNVRTYNLTTDTELGIFATIPLQGTENPNLKGLQFLTGVNGGILICNGPVVERYDLTGALVRTFTPSVPAECHSLADVKLTADGLQFWTVDEESTRLWLFDIASGTEIATFQPYLNSSALTQIAIYQPEGFEPPPPDEDNPPAGGEGCPNDLAVGADSGGGLGCAAQLPPDASGGTPEPPGPIPSLLIPRGPQQFQHRAAQRVPIRAFQAPPPPPITPEALPIGRRAIAKPAQRTLQRSWIHAYTPPLVPDPLPIGQHSFVAPATRTATRPYVFFVIPPTVAASDFPVGRPSAITYAQQPRHWFRRGRRSRIEYYALGAS